MDTAVKETPKGGKVRKRLMFNLVPLVLLAGEFIHFRFFDVAYSVSSQRHLLKGDRVL
ncbi:MAG: hypothetical protein ACREQV_02560 [Candidatus Binatia bacterium]